MLEQDFYSQILLYNILEDIRSDTIIDKKEENKYEYKVNMNIMVGIFWKKLIEVFLQTKVKEIVQKQEEFIDEIKNIWCQ